MVLIHLLYTNDGQKGEVLSMSTKSIITCPGCSAKLQLPAGFTTGKIKCPTCGKSLALKTPQAPVAPQTVPNQPDDSSHFADLTSFGSPASPTQPNVGLPPAQGPIPRAQPTSALGTNQHLPRGAAHGKRSKNSTGLLTLQVALIGGGIVAALAVLACVGFFVLRSQPTPISTSDAVSSFDFDETKKAADGGDAGAQNKLGFMYDQGNGVTQDYAEAVKWYRLSAEQGHAPAQYNLALMYAHGAGVPQDDAEALKWFRLAAYQGDADAQVKLGCMYVVGEGVPQDNAEAYIWFAIGVFFSKDKDKDKDKDKTKDAVYLRDKAASMLTPEELAKARNRGTDMTVEILENSAGNSKK